MKVSAIEQAGQIGKAWAESVKRRPLEKGVSRFVTVATDTLTETLGRDADGFVTLERKASNGAYELTVKKLDDKGMVKFLKFPDGSESKTTFFNGEPHRTEFSFFLTKKNGEKFKITGGAQGFYPPSVHKKIFLNNLDRLGNPKYEVDLSGAFLDDSPAVVQGLKRLWRPAKNLLEKFSRKNCELREFAGSIDRNA